MSAAEAGSDELCLGLVTAGQGPRPDLEDYHRWEFLRLGKRVHIISEHVFESVPFEEARKLETLPRRHSVLAPFRNPQAKGHRLGPGWEGLALSIDAYPPRLEACVTALENRGAQMTLFTCAAEFPGTVIRSRRPFIMPRRLLVEAVISFSRTVTRPLRLGVIVMRAHRDTDLPDWNNAMTGANVESTFLETDGSLRDIALPGTGTLDLACILGYGFGCAPGDAPLIGELERRLAAPVLLPGAVASQFVSQFAGRGRSLTP